MREYQWPPEPEAVERESRIARYISLYSNSFFAKGPSRGSGRLVMVQQDTGGRRRFVPEVIVENVQPLQPYPGSSPRMLVKSDN